jgi:hypothetical protein
VLCQPLLDIGRHDFKMCGIGLNRQVLDNLLPVFNMFCILLTNSLWQLSLDNTHQNSVVATSLAHVGGSLEC